MLGQFFSRHLQLGRSAPNLANMDKITGQRWHDLGGQEAGSIVAEDHDFALWEKRVDALMVIASSKGYFTVDGLRRVLEDMGENTFETMSYYERWVMSVNQNMVEAGAYSLSELGAKMEEVKSRGNTYGACASPAHEAPDD